MVEHERGRRNLSERVASIETTLEGISANQEKMSALLTILASERDQRRVYERIGKHAFEIGKVIGSAICGAWINSWWAKHPL